MKLVLRIKFFLCWHPCQGALFSYSFIIIFTQWYFYRVYLTELPLSSLPLRSTQATWSTTPFRERPWNNIERVGWYGPASLPLHLLHFFCPSSSPILSDMDKPTIWLEKVIVEVYGWIHFPRLSVQNDSTYTGVCLSGWAQIFLIIWVLILSHAIFALLRWHKRNKLAKLCWNWKNFVANCGIPTLYLSCRSIAP